MRQTRQGVRNLDDPQNQNRRRYSKTATCFHEFAHDRDCENCFLYDGNGRQLPCVESCRRCGAVRR